MTNAILFNKMRGSGREVTINLIHAGVEIVSVAGDHIAVWPYQVIDLEKESRTAGEGSFVVDHDQIHLLQVFDPALWNQVIERAPRARKTERRLTAMWWQIGLGMPDAAAGGIVLLILSALSWVGHQIYIWFNPS